MKNKIKELRKAVALVASRQTILAIENNKYNPTLKLAMKLLDTWIQLLKNCLYWRK